MALEFTGVITDYLDRSGISKKNEPYKAWQIRVSEEYGQYPNSICLDAFGEKVAIPAIGEKVTAYYNVKCDVAPDGKLWGKNNIWKIEPAVTSTVLPNAPITPADGVDPFAVLNPDFDKSDGVDPSLDIPF